MKISSIILLLVTGGLVSCTTPVSPPQKRSEVPAAENWTAAESFAGPAVDTWLFMHRDPRLMALINEAWQHNRELRVAAANLTAAAAQARIAGADRLPSLTGSGGAQRGRDIPGGATSDGYSAGLNLAWELDLWGRLADSTRAAEATYAASESDYAAARLSLAGQVARLWHDLIAARARLELNEETARNLRDNQRIVERRYDAGLRSALDLRLARTNALTAESDAAGARRSVAALARALEIMVGRYPANSIAVEHALPDVEGIPAVGLPAEMIARRPDLLAATARYEAAALSAGAARKLRLPQFTLTGNATSATGQLENLFSSDTGIWSLAGGLTAPLFQGGRIAGGVDTAEALERAALERYAERLLAAVGEVETALAAETLLAEQADLLEDVVAEADASEELAWNQYREGVVELTTVLEAQRRAFNSKRDLINLQNDRLRNRVALLLALGISPQATDAAPEI